MLRFGTVKATNPATAQVRVEFKSDRTVSFWLPVLMQNTGENKSFRMFSTGEQVACLMDKLSETGVVLGSMYTSSNAPDASSTVRWEFSDGAVFEYDANISKMTADISGTILEASPAGWAIKKTGESLRDLVADILSELALETHTSAAPGSPTTPPLNAAAYAVIQARVLAFFTS